MRIAAAFGKWDVDGFLAEIPNDQFEEWNAFFLLEPQGWHGINLAATRVSYIVAQVNAKTRLDERNFAIKPFGGVQTEQAEQARWEAASVRSQIENGETPERTTDEERRLEYVRELARELEETEERAA